MNPPSKSTLKRMRETAYDAQRNIEASYDARQASGVNMSIYEDPTPIRDDFSGIVRLLDAIMLDQELVRQITELMRK